MPIIDVHDHQHDCVPIIAHIICLFQVVVRVTNCHMDLTALALNTITMPIPSRVITVNRIVRSLAAWVSPSDSPHPKMAATMARRRRSNPTFPGYPQQPEPHNDWCLAEANHLKWWWSGLMLKTGAAP